MLKNKERWVGPFEIQRFLSRCHTRSFPRPQVSRSCYVITRYHWRKSPDERAFPLYVGGNTGKTKRFRTRIGDLLADAFGLFGKTGRHSGGQQLYKWCRRQNISALRLYIAWVSGVHCHRCLEVRLCEELKPQLNRKAPARCKKHPASRHA